MQLLFTPAELTLLATVLEECERRLRGAAGESDQAEAIRRRRHTSVEGLLEGFGATQPRFDADQLDELADVLRNCKIRGTEELSGAAEGPSRNALEQRHKLLQQILDKVIEACAMA